MPIEKKSIRLWYWKEIQTLLFLMIKNNNKERPACHLLNGMQQRPETQIPSFLAVWQIAHDTVEEWYFLAKDWFQSKLTKSMDENSKVPRREDFAITPPYFALHPWKCLGPSATSEERWTFLRFIKHFLYVSIVQGDAAASQRGSYMCQLAKANRDIFLELVQEMNRKGHNIEYSRGFLALYRDLDAAKRSQETTRKHGEEAHLLSWDEAVRLVPNLDYLPMKPMAVVHRPNEIISSCEQFLRAWTYEMFNLGVRYRHGLVDKVEAIRKEPTKAGESGYTYRVTYQDGATQDFDLLVLAAGVYSPVIATRMGIGEYVPTYPLRGFSLTTFMQEAGAGDISKSQENLLPKSFSLDSMYCTSVSPYMARWAGYGEFVGYPPKDKGVLSVGPSILSRYSRCVFPEAESGVHKEVALRCFRPASPDDLPIVGAIPKMPGVFIHTGHGTLGWTTGLATGHCLAQAIVEYLQESPASVAIASVDGKYYHLPNGIKMERKLLAPSRFVE
jgi:D-amino-acid dehydrogenase